MTTNKACFFLCLFITTLFLSISPFSSKRFGHMSSSGEDITILHNVHGEVSEHSSFSHFLFPPCFRSLPLQHTTSPLCVCDTIWFGLLFCYRVISCVGYFHLERLSHSATHADTPSGDCGPPERPAASYAGLQRGLPGGGSGNIIVGIHPGVTNTHTHGHRGINTFFQNQSNGICGLLLDVNIGRVIRYQRCDQFKTREET